MASDISDLPTRPTPALRLFAAHRPVLVERFPAAVVEPNPPDDDGDDYWRFASTRQTLEGLCFKYQGYDAGGDENDCNLDIVPGPGSAWMLDASLLTSCAAANGAPPFDPCKIKRNPLGQAMIEAEATLDDGLHGQFTDDGLPIRGGSWPPDGAYNEGKGPTGRQVGVYGVFGGDYGHGGRPEIHPFDAFWRFHSAVGATTASIDLGVFQDDSNRFNHDWSDPPVDVELRVPFAIDFPVTSQPVVKTVTFEIRKSPRCQKVSKSVVSMGVASVSREYTGATATLGSGVNRLTINVVDHTGTAAHNLGLGLADVHVTRSVNIVGKLRACWLSGWIRVRVAVGQDGFWYANLTGPTSPGALQADGDPVTFEPPSEFATPDVPDVIRPRGRARAASDHPIVTGATLDLIRRSARMTVESAGQRQEVDIHARPAAPDFARTSDPQCFGLSTRLVQKQPTRRAIDHVATVDLAPLVGSLSGLRQKSGAVRSVPARVRLLDPAPLELHAWYARAKGGLPGGDAHPANRLLLEQAPPFRAELTAVVVHRLDGTSEHLVGHVAARGVVRLGAWSAGDGHRRATMEVPSLRGESPAVVQMGCVVHDSMGLSAHTTLISENVALLEPSRWLADAIGLVADDVADAARKATSTYLSTCDPRDLAAGRMLTMLADQARQLEDSEQTPVRRVSGVAALAIRAAELVSTFTLRPPSPAA